MSSKPARPTPDFPLFAHAAGKWAKKINGKLYYFGRWDDPDGALAEYQAKFSNQEVSAPSWVTISGLSLLEACDRFIHSKANARDRGELAERSFKEYYHSCKWLLKFLGRETLVESLQPQDFARYRQDLAKRRNVVGVGNEITRIRVLFKYCLDAQLIAEPMRFGPDFKRPSAKALRRHRRLSGPKLFTPLQVALLLDECGVHLRAMIHLAVNAGFGNTDCATLPLNAVDLERGWVHFPRPKTEVDRSVPLWPETVRALKKSLRRRYQPTEGCPEYFFVLPNGQSWDSSTNPISKYFRQALGRAGIRRGGFYWLRHCCETIGGGAKDQVAMNAIMGHVDRSMAAVYREEIAEDRLRAVTEHIRKWFLSVYETAAKAA